MTGPELKATASAEVSHKTVKQIDVTDPMLFKPHEVKQVDEWSWRRLRYVKWFVYVDCNTGHLKKWKLS